ncbi:MAG: efflux RND transporter permease subunit [Candidatus Eisenbacteria bacterium]
MSRSPRRHGLPAFSIRRPVGTIMLTSVVIVLGVFFLSGLSLDLLPSIVYPQIRASVNNRGVEPTVLEETVAKPLEATLSTTENLTRMETEVEEDGSRSIFTSPMEPTSTSRSRTRPRTSTAPGPTCPKGGSTDDLQVRSVADSVYEVAFSSATRDLIFLRDWAEFRLRPQLLTVEGIASVDVSGGLTREIQVILDQERLRSYGPTVSRVHRRPAGGEPGRGGRSASSPRREVVGKTAGKFRNVEDVRRCS